MDATRAISAYCRKQVPSAEANKSILRLTTISGEKNGACSGTVAHTQNIAFFEWGTKWSWSEGIVVGFVAIGVIGHRKSIVTR